MHKKARFEVYFGSFGKDVDPAELSKLFRKRPDKYCYKKGDDYLFGNPKKNIIRQRKIGAWAIKSKVNSYKLDDHAQKFLGPLLRRLSPAGRKKMKKFDNYLTFVMTFYGREDYRDVTFCLDSESIKIMSSIGVQLNIDMYDFAP